LLTGIDDAGRQTIMADAFNGPVTFTYDFAGQLTALTNPRGKTNSVRISPVRRG
jgi:YD repeat-containing protein